MKKIGYYIYNNTKVFLKKSALFEEIRKNPNGDVRFWFNEYAYSKYNWKVEPVEDIDELYRKRAKELRDKYDYLILMFSGGSDSYQILRSFTDNNIHLDEVRTTTVSLLENAANEASHNCGFHIGRISEHRLAALPRLNRLAITNPKTKISILDISNFIKECSMSDKFFQDNKEVFSLYTDYWGIKGVYELQQASKTAEMISGKVGIIYGNDKPYPFRIGNKLYTTFNDVSLNFAMMSDNDSMDRISFFWYENPDIVCKQLHMFKKALKENKDLKTIFYSGLFHIEMSVLEKLIYPSTYEPQCYQYDIKNHDDDILGFFGGRAQFADNVMKEIRDPMNVKSNKIMIRKNMACRIQSKYYEIGDIE